MSRFSSIKVKEAIKNLSRFGAHGGVVPNKPKFDDWMIYHGEGCPVDNEELVEVELFDGVKSKGSASSFSWWNLTHGSALDAIKCYRIILGDEVDLSPEEKLDLRLEPGETFILPNNPEEKNVGKKYDWLNYHGTGCPVDKDQTVEVVMNSGGIARDFAGVFIWSTNGLGGIKKFRIILDEKIVEKDVRSHNVGDSDYAKHKIQPWDIWLEYQLNPWDADIIKRTLRDKASDSRRLDYEKIIHIAQERIRQIDAGEGY